MLELNMGGRRPLPFSLVVSGAHMMGTRFKRGIATCRPLIFLPHPPAPAPRPSTVEPAAYLVIMSQKQVRLVLVTGARPQISTLLRQAGVEEHFRDGVRITSPEALKVRYPTRRDETSLGIPIHVLFSSPA